MRFFLKTNLGTHFVYVFPAGALFRDFFEIVKDPETI